MRDIPWAKLGVARAQMESGQPARAITTLQGLVGEDPAFADAYDVLVCAPWGANVPTTPDGWDCDSNTWGDTQCNLGHESPGVEVVCAFGACTAGCYEDKDCPSGTNCANPGNLSTCQ